MLEAKDKRKCSPKKKGVQKNFSGDLQKKVEKNISADLQNFNHSKNSAVLEPRTGQFSKTWSLRAQGLQNVSSRTSRLYATLNMFRH